MNRGRARICLAVCLSLGLSGVPCSAAEEAVQSPGAKLVQQLSPAPLRVQIPVVGRDVQRLVLSNGLVVYLAFDPAAPIVSLTATFRAGTLYRGASLPGTPEVMAQLLRLGGTSTLPSTRLADALETLGVEAASGTSAEALTLNLRALPEHADAALALLADMVRHPAFQPNSLSATRSRLLAGLRRLPETPADLLTRELARLLYPSGHPAGQAYTAADLTALRREDLLTYYRQTVRPDNMWLSVVGNLSTATLTGRIEQLFGNWAAGEPLALTLAPAAPYRPSPGVYFLAREVSQATIVLGHPGVSRTSPDRAAIEVMNAILGGNGFATRLAARLRTRDGLTYGVSSAFLSTTPTLGLFRILFRTRSTAVPQAITATLQEMRRLQDSLVSADELAIAKDTLVNTFPFRFASRAAGVANLLSLEVTGERSDYYETVLPGYEVVSREEVRRVAQQYLHPDTATILVLGDPALSVPLAEFGPVRTLSPPAGAE
ncbi:MAG TPA: pitrilysin family protein [Candidatus Sulfotelmatobacter sp.]|nr:pitrilysin family protein [Candidatus Sulfotelmatobacter sp.]